MNKELILHDLKQTPRQFLAYLLLGFSLNWIKSIDLGMNSWSTLSQGLSINTGLSFGTITQLISVVIIIFTIFMKVYPGYATILNTIFIGYFINIFERYSIYYTSDSLIINILLIIIAMLIFNIGIYLYLSCSSGAGARDGLMIGLVKNTGKSVTVIRTSIEAIVFIIGWILGGTIGIGTIIVTLIGGYTLDKTFNLFNYNSKEINHTNITSYFKKAS